jgi:toxin FitB
VIGGRELSGLESQYHGQTLEFGANAAHCYGQIAARPEVKAREPQLIDMLIAAQAQFHSIPIATPNVKDFD